MRIEAAGAQVTTAVVKVIDSFQNESDGFDALAIIDSTIRKLLLDHESSPVAPMKLIQLLQNLCWLRDKVAVLAMPPDADDLENDIPALSI